MRKEQEAEQYRLKLEAMSRQQAQGTEPAAKISPTHVSSEEVISVSVKVESPTSIAIETVTS